MDEATESALPNRFAHSFLKAQELSAKRSRFSWFWPLLEFWRNKVDEHVKVMDEFVAPLLKEALATKRTNPTRTNDDKGLEDDTTLLEHLVALTEGELGLWHCNPSR